MSPVELPGGLLVLDADEAVLVGRFVLAGHPRVRSAYVAGGLPFPVEGEQLVAYFQGRIDQRRREVPSPAQVVARVASRDAAGSDHLPSLPHGASVAAWSSWLSVSEAAQRLGISTRATTGACGRGALSAVRIGEGRGEWRIDPASLCTYEPRRSARDRRDDASAA